MSSCSSKISPSLATQVNPQSNQVIETTAGRMSEIKECQVRHEMRLYIEHVPTYAVAHADHIPFQFLRPFPDSYSIHMTSWNKILHSKQYYILSSLHLHPLLLHLPRSTLTSRYHRQPPHTRATCRLAQATHLHVTLRQASPLVVLRCCAASILTWS